MITKLELKNFTAFSNIALDFSPKINIIIGENGTGKTHLLKVAYALCTGALPFKNQDDVSKEKLEAALTTKLLSLFMPLDDKVGKMYHEGATKQANILAQFVHGQEINLTFANNSRMFRIENSVQYEQYFDEAVFIPTKEVLSFMKGFSSLYEKYDLSFDKSYQDIVRLLELPEMRSKALHEKSKWAMEEIEKICGGRFIFYGGGKVTFKAKDVEYSANAIAEGFRKLGILSRLLETGSIQLGNGSLFWDEPESGLNPQLLQLLVEILLELSRHGQQIFLTSHDYVLLKWFDILMDKSKGDHVRFHVLHRQEDNNIQATSFDNYLAIMQNPIDAAFSLLIDKEIERQMEGIGR